MSFQQSQRSKSTNVPSSVLDQQQNAQLFRILEKRCVVSRFITIIAGFSWILYGTRNGSMAVWLINTDDNYDIYMPIMYMCSVEYVACKLLL